ncbi:MAG: PfkB family carbohydrate kinase [Rubrobacter sp.]|nr:PfkB family carbohydrate kinase [Rubrobacter sp.]
MSPSEEIRPEVTTLGEAMAVLTPASRGALRGVRGFESGVGGAEVNVAVALARLGHLCGWYGHLGEDELGAAVSESLCAEGVDVSRVVRDPDNPTGLYLKEFRARDTLRVHYYRKDSAASRMSAEDSDLDWLLSSRIVHLQALPPFSPRAATSWCAEWPGRPTSVESSFVSTPTSVNGCSEKETLRRRSLL